MNKEQRHINLLRRWISGDITAKEERKLEDAAAQDEFLRDAWAGYQANAEADHGAKLAKLRSRLAQQRQPKAKPRLLRPWMRIAAAVALLLIAGWFVIQNPMGDQDMLAKTESAAPAEPEEIQADNGFLENNEATSEQEETTAEEKMLETNLTSPDVSSDYVVPPGATSSPISRSSSPTNKKDQVTVELPAAGSAPSLDQLADATSDEYISADRTQESEVAPIVLDAVSLTEEEIVTTSPPPPPAAAPDVYRTQNQGPPPARLGDPYLTSNAGFKIPKPGYRIVRGYVTDDTGNPLIGASILEQGSANGTVADMDGYYELTVSEQSQTLLVNYTGYETNEVSIGENEEISVVLAEGQVLEEVVVTGLGVKRDRQAYQSVEESGQAKPVGGFSDLREYIKNNATANAGRANVKMRFYVQADGRPTNFSIINSTNTSLNTEAIRLIETGPDWEITNGTAPLEIVYIVKFR